MGAEMCIRDRVRVTHRAHGEKDGTSVPSGTYRSTVATEAVRSNDRILQKALGLFSEKGYDCLLYTSDAADERSSVDLGGRRILKKKNNKRKKKKHYNHPE